MSHCRRRVVLIQLPIPPLGPGPIRGNVPLAAGYLTLYARQRGLDAFYDLAILPPGEANELGDLALVGAILAREPWLVGFTCYLWNIDRTLWLCARLKERRPDLRIVLGGPEITLDNGWVLEQPCIDYAVIGEGEQTFADLLLALLDEDIPPISIPGLVGIGVAAGLVPAPIPRKPLPNLDAISSPYLAGILDAADEQMLLLETIRGCIFKCKFCYYPKSYDDLYFVSEERILANLRHAQERGVREVVLLDPTLNQARNFADFLRLLIRGNPERQFTYFGELRAEGITPEIARLLCEANFTEVEVGLQSIDPKAQVLMDRKNNLRAVERGIRAMLDVGIKVKVDLIIGLPGDTAESVRRGMRYLRDGGLYTEVQVFNLAVLPGTAFRQEAKELGLVHQSRPPYYVTRTPTLSSPEMFQLMQEAQDVFEMEWDVLPPPVLEFVNDAGLQRGAVIDLNRDAHPSHGLGIPAQRAQAFTLRLRSDDFCRDEATSCDFVACLLADNPFTTLQIILEPAGDPRSLTIETLTALLDTCQRRPTYLDRFYAMQPGKPIGAKRLVIVLAGERCAGAGDEWLHDVGEFATIVQSDGCVADRGTTVEAAVLAP